MPELLIFIIISLLLGALPVRTAIMLLTGALPSGKSRITIKEIISSVGLETVVVVLLLEACKGVAISYLAMNFWQYWHLLAVAGILLAMTAQRLAYPRFISRSMAVFFGGLLVISPDVFKLYLALWLSLIILLRNQKLSMTISTLTTLAIVMGGFLNARHLQLLFAGYTLLLAVDWLHKQSISNQHML